jgi:hypothetical protein
MPKYVMSSFGRFCKEFGRFFLRNRLVTLSTVSLIRGQVDIKKYIQQPVSYVGKLNLRSCTEHGACDIKITLQKCLFVNII